MRSKLLQIFFDSIGFDPISRYVYHPSNLDYQFDADGITLKKQFDIVSYNSQFDATSFSLSVMKDSGIDITKLSGIVPSPYSSFKAVQLISNSDNHE